MQLFTKSDVRGKGDKSAGGVGSQRTLDVIDALGGISNLEGVDACATRLRVSVNNPKNVNVEKLKELGAVAVVINGNATQSIFGGEADVLKTNINEYIGSLSSDTKKIIASGK